MNYATTAHKMRRKLLGLAVLEVTTNTHRIRIEASEEAVDFIIRRSQHGYGFSNLRLYCLDCGTELSMRRHSPGVTDAKSHQFNKRP